MTNILESTFKTWDDCELFCRTWSPTQKSNRAIIMMHRGHEHSGRLIELDESLGFDCWRFAYDYRGHGKSPGRKGFTKDFSDHIKDLDAYVRYISIEHEIPIENISIVANSIGAIICSAWVHDYAPRIRCFILAAAAFEIKLYIPFAIPGLRFLHKFFPNAAIKSYVKPSMLTHDKEQIKAYESDPLIARDISVNILLQLHDISSRLLNDAQAIFAPCLMLVADKDYVVQKHRQLQFFNKLSSSMKQIHVLKGFHHAIFYEKDRHQAIQLTKDFIINAYKQDSIYNDATLLYSDEHGFTKVEFEKLKKPAKLMKGIFFKSQQTFMKTLGLLSHSIRLGWESGFDSGKSLDHVYKNKALGVTLLGRAIDRTVLNAIGWRGIRQRRVHIVDAMNEVKQFLKEQGETLKILDIAAGPGRYVFDFLKSCDSELIDHILLRDNEQQNLDAAKVLFKDQSQVVINYELADALNLNALEDIEVVPNLVIVSGLYELFPSNKPIKNSLNGIASGLAKGGYLIYTSQIWHPEMEMIARVLTNRDGEPWIMRRRTQIEMDSLVSEAGLKKVKTIACPFGIFNVSIAKKVED
ncbi:MAG: hypothetical protein COA79_05550 [Planctomycetota bacterium]|nr:MAG: hypothetical protein COA79_05550 [Planctomycetota bacterium]